MEGGAERKAVILRWRDSQVEGRVEAGGVGVVVIMESGGEGMYRLWWGSFGVRGELGVDKLLRLEGSSACEGFKMLFGRGIGMEVSLLCNRWRPRLRYGYGSITPRSAVEALELMPPMPGGQSLEPRCATH